MRHVLLAASTASLLPLAASLPAPEVLTTDSSGGGFGIALVIACVFGFCFLLVVLILILKSTYRTVERGSALIVTSMARNRPSVSFTGSMVIPIINRAEIIDISLKTIDVDRRGANGLICKDKIRADIKVMFYVRINDVEEDVLKVAGSVGVQRASDPHTLEGLFQAKFSEALKTVGMGFEFRDLYSKRLAFKDEIVKIIGKDLNGYVLEDVAIDFLEQTPLHLLDPANILDAEGRKLIIQLTTEQKILANNFERDSEQSIKERDVKARTFILEREKDQVEAEANQKREIANLRARANADTAKIEAAARQESEQAHLTADQEIGRSRENATREVQVAGKRREGVLLVEGERIERERTLEAIARQRATALSEIEKEKAVAIEQKNIAEVVRERIAVEKSVAEEEERIKDVRALSGARRERDVALTKAEEKANEARIKEVTQSEASAAAASNNAKEKLIMAEAEQMAAEKEVQGQIRRAEGKQAEAAANGLAMAKVKEADALVMEKTGYARARVIEIEAEANKKASMAAVDVRQAEAKVISDIGKAKAGVIELEAEAHKKAGLAQVDVRHAEAAVIAQVGDAEAHALEAKMLSEAKGLAEKATSMGMLSEATRGHEEYRLNLQAQLDLAKIKVGASVEIANSQAAVMSEAVKHAKVEIVGGDGVFFERWRDMITYGKGIDAMVQGSTVLQTIGGEYLSGQRSLPGDVKDVLQGLKADDVRDLTLAAALPKLFKGADPAKLAALAKHAQALGLLGDSGKPQA